MMSNLTGNELIQVFGNPTVSFTTLAKAVGASPDLIGKLDKADVHKFLNSHEIKTWFSGADFNDLDAGVHFIKAEGDNVLNKPDSGIFKVSQFNIDQYILQEAERYSTGERYSRAKIGTLWGEWNKTGDGEVTPPSDLPMGKEGQMLVYRGDKWVATSPIEIASSLHVNHDVHFDKPYPIFKYYDGAGSSGGVSAEDLASIEWNNLATGVDFAVYRAVNNDGNEYVRVVLKCTQGERLDYSLVGLGYNGSAYSSTPLFFEGKNNFISSNFSSFYQNTLITFMATTKSGGKSLEFASYFDGTLRLYADGIRENDVYIDMKCSRNAGSDRLYIKLRTRRDFGSYYEPSVPPEVEI